MSLFDATLLHYIRKLPQLFKWVDNLSVKGEGVFFKNTPDGATISIGTKKDGADGVEVRYRVYVLFVTNDGGSAGSSTTDCTLTYTLKNGAGTTLGTGRTPLKPRYLNPKFCEYTVPAADSIGYGYRDASGNWQLIEAVQEQPKGDLVTSQVTYGFDTGTGQFTRTYQTLLVLESTSTTTGNIYEPGDCE